MSEFSMFVTVERASHLKRMRFAGLMAALIACVLYRSDWTVLRPGLIVLLGGQIGVLVALLARNIGLSKFQDGDVEMTAVAAWFKSEESFIRWLAIFENACQIIGFLMLGYGIWLATHSGGLALTIGILYPASVYFGVTRRRNLDAIRRLRVERENFI